MERREEVTDIDKQANVMISYGLNNNSNTQRRKKLTLSVIITTRLVLSTPPQSQRTFW